MLYKIKAIELFVRETPPGRMLFTLGSRAASPVAQQGLTSPIAHVRLVLSDDAGHETFGCSADRLSVRWLDKRPDRSESQKLRDLVELIEAARGIALAAEAFSTPFEFWQQSAPKIMLIGTQARQEELTSSFASALFERAVIDAYCRFEQMSFFEAVKSERIGFRPSAIHPTLNDADFVTALPQTPLTSFWIRHTIGADDPLTPQDISVGARVDDGLPETLGEYIARDGVRYFKVKVTGDIEADLQRLEKIWRVIVHAKAPVVTLDANEAYSDLAKFEQFVRRLEAEITGMFQHIEYIEQPLPRSTTLDPTTSKWIRTIAQRKPLLIDEADGTTDAYRQALQIGYQGVSHKNCKGVFKSLANFALVAENRLRDRDAFMSGEDLQNLPVVPLQQDFVTLGLLGIEHCERNGHHYNFGLSMLSELDKRNCVASHPDLYVTRNGESFLNIVEGRVDCGSLQCVGFGVIHEPDWPSMTPMRRWVDSRHPSG